MDELSPIPFRGLAGSAYEKRNAFELCNVFELRKKVYLCKIQECFARTHVRIPAIESQQPHGDSHPDGFFCIGTR